MIQNGRKQVAFISAIRRLDDYREELPFSPKLSQEFGEIILFRFSRIENVARIGRHRLRRLRRIPRFRRGRKLDRETLRDRQKPGQPGPQETSDRRHRENRRGGSHETDDGQGNRGNLRDFDDGTGNLDETSHVGFPEFRSPSGKQKKTGRLRRLPGETRGHEEQAGGAETCETRGEIGETRGGHHEEVPAQETVQTQKKPNRGTSQRKQLRGISERETLQETAFFQAESRETRSQVSETFGKPRSRRNRNGFRPEGGYMKLRPG